MATKAAIKDDPEFNPRNHTQREALMKYILDVEVWVILHTRFPATEEGRFAVSSASRT